MAAIISICVDPRLDHNVIRAQVQARLQRMGLPIENVFIPNDTAANPGGNFGGVVRLLMLRKQPIVMAAVLQHDDCLAEQEGLRYAISDCVDAIRASFQQHNIDVPILSGTITTATSAITWSDEPNPGTQVLNFQMPRMFG